MTNLRVKTFLVRSKHGGWRMHESKPATMPDNPNYPKKVLNGRSCTMITLLFSGPSMGEAVWWLQRSWLQGFKLAGEKSELKPFFPGWRSRSDAKHHPESSCDRRAACQGVAQLIRLVTRPWKEQDSQQQIFSLKYFREVRERQDGGWGGAGARSAPSPLRRQIWREENAPSQVGQVCVWILLLKKQALTCICAVSLFCCTPSS